MTRERSSRPVARHPDQTSFVDNWAVDSNGKPHIVYEDDNDTLWYTSNVGGDFAPPDFPFAAFDACGC